LEDLLEKSFGDLEMNVTHIPTFSQRKGKKNLIPPPKNKVKKRNYQIP